MFSARGRSTSVPRNLWVRKSTETVVFIFKLAFTSFICVPALNRYVQSRDHIVPRDQVMVSWYNIAREQEIPHVLQTFNSDRTAPIKLGSLVDK